MKRSLSTLLALLVLLPFAARAGDELPPPEIEVRGTAALETTPQRLAATAPPVTAPQQLQVRAEVRLVYAIGNR
ncbi:hypothetical protein EDC39_10555 [Geothermobacter ehrlichii]|uniref:Uncharacterized protein n=1 Tax=Geothermobacter ehrlichii TaxID=213224 RepID=A0A5D3WL53_9BACT|nr:hypothetical protein [Geothermobacter ehrlichii]TYO98693.1 hypothetical protein EDC39_10555 [Geothermobacter ehrlichii]